MPNKIDWHRSRTLYGCVSDAGISRVGGDAVRGNPATTSFVRRTKTENNALSLALGVGIALLPKCPACCLAYASLLSSFGIVSLPHFNWLLPTMLALLSINLIALGIGAKTSHAYGPFLLSLLGAASIAVDKLWLNSSVLSWAGVVILLTASAWNFGVRKIACRAATAAL